MAMGLDRTVDAEFLKLLAARTLTESGDEHGAWEKLRELKLSYLPPMIADKVVDGWKIHLGPNPLSGPTQGPDVRPVIDEALGYYGAVNKLAQGGAVFPEMTEELAVNAINQHWMKSYLFYLAIALLILVFGGTIATDIKFQGLQDNMEKTSGRVDKLSADLVTNQGKVDQIGSAVTLLGLRAQADETALDKALRETAANAATDLQAKAKAYEEGTVQPALDQSLTDNKTKLQKYEETQEALLVNQESLAAAALRNKSDSLNTDISSYIAKIGQDAKDVTKQRNTIDGLVTEADHMVVELGNLMQISKPKTPTTKGKRRGTPVSVTEQK
ncbi:MAG: hypothetical protein JOZ13_03140 [Alphaproteobacteria bacterium]|nr:hypothetical protein [Alphaproteobacteria bacterium]